MKNRSWSGPRALLTKQQATEIYMIGKLVRHQGSDPMQGSRSAQIAKTYGVSSKAIRDIWNRRTWQNETRHLWDKHEQPVIRYRRPVLLSNQCELLSASWESCGKDRYGRSPALSELSALQSLSPSECPETWLPRSVKGGAICAYSCDEQEIDVQHVKTSASEMPSSPPAAYCEGPFGLFLPPTSVSDADPFHADWPYW